MTKTKPKKCRECGVEFTPRYSTTQIACSYGCAIKIAERKEKNKRAKEARKKRAEFNRNDPKWLKSKLQSTVNEIARLIDHGLPCLATETNGQMHGGHVFSRGGHTQMRYNLHNIHRQSAYSNNKQSHDGLMQEKLAEEYGEDYLEFLKDMRGSEVQKYTIQELQDAYDNARDFRNYLKKSIGDKPFPKKMRIALRNEANVTINLYPDDLCVWE